MALPQFITPDNYNVSATQASSGFYRLTVNITPSDGYKLDVSNTSVYQFEYYNTNTKTNTLSTVYTASEDLITLRANYFNVAYNPTLDFSAFPPAIPTTPAAEIINNVEHSNLTSQQDGNNFVFGLSVGYNPEKYQFENVPTVNYFDLNGNENTVNFTSVSDFVEYSAHVENVDISHPININGKISLLVVTRETLTNATISSITPERIFANSVLNVSVKANESFYFAETPYLRISGNIFNFSLADTHTANLTLDLSSVTISENANYFTVNADAIAEIIPPKVVNIHENLTNCNVSSIEPAIIFDNSDFEIVVISEIGYYFDRLPQIEIVYLGGIQTINFVLEDNHTAKINVSLPDLDLSNVTDIYINAVADVETVYARNYGAINVYHVDNEQLKAFAEKRFFKVDETSGFVNYIDLANYVISLKRVFCNIANELPTVLECGNYNTEIETSTPQNDNANINFGVVTIPAHNNDITDTQSEIKIFLPFYGFADISSDFVGKEIELQYDVNIISGVAFAKLFHAGIMFASYETNLFADVLYKTYEINLQSSFVGVADFRTPQINGFTPYIIVKWFETENQHIYNNDCVRKQLSNVSGFAKVTEITDLNVNAIESEKDLILSMLSNGVIF